MERRLLTYENMLASGTIAFTTLALPRMSWPWIWPRRELRSPMTEPVYSSGVTTSTFMIGAVVRRHLEVDHREAGEHARAEHRLEALLDARDVFLRHVAADDVVLEG